MQQKLILLGIFGMGIFVIAAAILCKVYGLYPPLISYEYLNWFLPRSLRLRLCYQSPSHLLPTT